MAPDRDAGVAHVGEVGQSGPARLVKLPEDDLLLVAMDGSPRSDPTLQGAADAGAEFGVASDHLLEDGDRSKAGRGLQHRHDLRLEDGSQRVRATPLPNPLPPRGQAGMLLEAIGAGRAERRLRGRNLRRVGLTELHVEPHLVIGHVAAGQAVIPLWREEPCA